MKRRSILNYRKRAHKRMGKAIARVFDQRLVELWMTPHPFIRAWMDRNDAADALRYALHVWESEGGLVSRKVSRELVGSGDAVG